ncbi:MAG: hypothetical protein ABEI86_08935 [Halobacteriaceae archaeon]
MHLARPRLMVLFNALYDQDVTSIPVRHPCEAIGELIRIELDDRGEATIRFTQRANSYRDARETIPAKFGEPAYKDLPDAETYVRATVASGHVGFNNRDAIESFIDRYGYPDLTAGHKPVVLGIDANIIPWRVPEVLDIDSATGSRDAKDRAPTNGYALATGVKEELDWYYKQKHTRELTAVFSEEFARLDNQPAGANREGFLGLYEYRRLRTNRTVDIVECETGDTAIVDGYKEFNETSRKRALLLSNDRGFVDQAVEAGVPAQHIAFPYELPRKWTQATELRYYLAVLFGVVRLPKVTVYGVWNGKDGRHWQHEQLDIECCSPKIEPQLERDLSILDAID